MTDHDMKELEMLRARREKYNKWQSDKQKERTKHARMFREMLPILKCYGFIDPAGNVELDLLEAALQK